jgi:CheY-like chemotaxis protein
MAASIMVIDDDPTIRALLDEILTQAHYESHLYTYALPDSEEIRHVHPDLVICDYLEDGDNVGGDLLATLRHDPAFATTPLIVCSTAHAHLRESTGWWDQPGVSIVSKPFDIDDLLGTVQQALAPPAAIPAVVATARTQHAAVLAVLPHALSLGLAVWSRGSAGSGARPGGNC